MAKFKADEANSYAENKRVIRGIGARSSDKDPPSRSPEVSGGAEKFFNEAIKNSNEKFQSVEKDQSRGSPDSGDKHFLQNKRCFGERRVK